MLRKLGRICCNFWQKPDCKPQSVLQRLIVLQDSNLRLYYSTILLRAQQNFYFVAFAQDTNISRLPTANPRSLAACPGLCFNKIMVLCRSPLRPLTPFDTIVQEAGLIVKSFFVPVRFSGGGLSR